MATSNGLGFRCPSSGTNEWSEFTKDGIYHRNKTYMNLSVRNGYWQMRSASSSIQINRYVNLTMDLDGIMTCAYVQPPTGQWLTLRGHSSKGVRVCNMYGSETFLSITGSGTVEMNPENDQLAKTQHPYTHLLVRCPFRMGLPRLH